MSDLFQYICSFENLDKAFIKARRAKRPQEAVARFEHNLESELWQLHEELNGHAYQSSAYRSFYPTEAKRRLISAAP